MRNSAHYARKVKRIVTKARKASRPEAPDPIRLLVSGVLAENVTPRQATKAMLAVEQEFIDFNELRVSPVKDIVECLGRDFPGARQKAEMLHRSLNAVFDHTNALRLDFLAKATKREVRRTLREKLGLSLYAEGVVTLYGFEGHAVPVDELLLESLKSGEKIAADSDLLDLQGFLERITAAKDDVTVHEALRRYAARHAARIHRQWARREKQAREKAEAEARARAEAEAKAKAEAEARARAKAEAEARAKAKARKKPKARRKPRPRRATTQAAGATRRKKPTARKVTKRKK